MPCLIEGKMGWWSCGYYKISYWSNALYYHPLQMWQCLVMCPTQSEGVLHIVIYCCGIRTLSKLWPLINTPFKKYYWLRSSVQEFNNYIARTSMKCKRSVESDIVPYVFKSLQYLDDKVNLTETKWVAYIMPSYSQCIWQFISW